MFTCRTGGAVRQMRGDRVIDALAEIFAPAMKRRRFDRMIATPSYHDARRGEIRREIHDGGSRCSARP
jgi:hypothetical protein